MRLPRFLLMAGIACAAAPPAITLELRDFATMPMTGAVDGIHCPSLNASAEPPRFATAFNSVK